MPSVAQVVARTLAGRGVDTVFGLIGSGNFHLANALRAEGARLHAARHETAAVSMADGWARTLDRVGVATVHQGPGLTNAITALTEAVKGRTPLLLLAAEAPAAALGSTFRLDQDALVRSVGALAERVHGPATAAADAARALHRAATERLPVVLMLPTDVQARACEPRHAADPAPAPAPTPAAPVPAADAIDAVADLLAGAHRPAIVAGRGAHLAGAGPALRALGERTGALLASSAMAHGLFRGDPFDLGIAGGFATPLTQRLLPQADLVLAVGAGLNRWTTRNDEIFAADAALVQVDVEPAAIGRNRPVRLGLVGDADAAARALVAELDRRGVRRPGLRSPALAEEIEGSRWGRVPYAESTRDGYVDPRTLSIELDRLLPSERTLALDSGHFMGYPAMYLDVPDPAGFTFTQGFQSIGLGLPSAIGAALARPDRLCVAALGDGGALMALPELETVARLSLPMLLVVYNDAAYGAEVHLFAPAGEPVDLVRFPDTDFAALARAAGAEGITVRTAADLAPVARWLERREGPLLIDAKVDPAVRADWVDEALRGH
jgi:thiamine pyrophosphate-dependent acetolactate synthase large subunit-like protein